MEKTYKSEYFNHQLIYSFLSRIVNIEMCYFRVNLIGYSEIPIFVENLEMSVNIRRTLFNQCTSDWYGCIKFDRISSFSIEDSIIENSIGRAVGLLSVANCEGCVNNTSLFNHKRNDINSNIYVQDVNSIFSQCNLSLGESTLDFNSQKQLIGKLKIKNTFFNVSYAVMFFASFDHCFLVCNYLELSNAKISNSYVNVTQKMDFYLSTFINSEFSRNINIDSDDFVKCKSTDQVYTEMPYLDIKCEEINIKCDTYAKRSDPILNTDKNCIEVFDSYFRDLRAAYGGGAVSIEGKQIEMCMESVSFKGCYAEEHGGAVSLSNAMRFVASRICVESCRSQNGQFLWLHLLRGGEFGENLTSIWRSPEHQLTMSDSVLTCDSGDEVCFLRHFNASNCRLWGRCFINVGKFDLKYSIFVRNTRQVLFSFRRETHFEYGNIHNNSIYSSIFASYYSELSFDHMVFYGNGKIVIAAYYESAPIGTNILSDAEIRIAKALHVNVNNGFEYELINTSTVFPIAQFNCYNPGTDYLFIIVFSLIGSLLFIVVISVIIVYAITKRNNAIVVERDNIFELAIADFG